jgi:two-component system sensor histidine kinase DegS
MTKVAIIGGGLGGTSLIEIFHDDPLVQIVGVADTDMKAPGIRLAKRLKIPVTKDYRTLLRSRQVDLVIDVTGNRAVQEELEKTPRLATAVIGGPSAKFMWQLIEERVRSKEEIERHLHEYQSLYRLYVKEVQLAVTEERTRIACDIHDGLVQTLVGLNYKLEFCEELMRRGSPNSLAQLSETKALLKAAIEEAREVVFNLRPIYLDKQGLIPALRSYLKSYGKQYRIKTHLSVAGSEERLPSRGKIFLFRIVQEALANVQKHASAKRTGVRLEINDRRMLAEISDDGVGFDWEAIRGRPEKLASFGLKGMSERAKLLGGRAVVESREGKGTKVFVEIPLERDEIEQDQNTHRG